MQRFFLSKEISSMFSFYPPLLPQPGTLFDWLTIYASCNSELLCLSNAEGPSCNLCMVIPSFLSFVLLISSVGSSSAVISLSRLVVIFASVAVLSVFSVFHSSPPLAWDGIPSYAWRASLGSCKISGSL